MVLHDVAVPVGEDQQAVGPADAATDEPNEVDGRGVRPMHVLHDHDRRLQSSVHQLQDPAERRLAVLGVERLFEVRILGGHVPDRTERPCGQQVVAAPDEGVRVVSGREELPHE